MIVLAWFAVIIPVIGGLRSSPVATVRIPTFESFIGTIGHYASIVWGSTYLAIHGVW